MKLRIRGNSIRLRLSRTEVAQFAQTGNVEDAVEFAPAQQGLIYRIHTTSESEAMSATFANNCLCVFVPRIVAESWMNSEQVGIEAAQELDDSKTLRILVEKDFACLIERADEDETDAFPNPRAAATGGEI